MRAGELKHVATIRSNTITSQNTFSEDITTPVDVLSRVRCDVRSLGGREIASLQQKWAEARYEATLRASSTVLDATMQFIWHDKNDRVLEILNIEDADSRASRPEVKLLLRDFAG